MNIRPAYVDHRLSDPDEGEMARNRERATRWVAWLAQRYLVAPVADWILLSSQWPESRRATGLEIDCALVELCGTVILVGSHVSEGMRLESRRARNLVNLTGLSNDAPVMSYLRELCGDAVAMEVHREIDARMSVGGFEKR